MSAQLPTLETHVTLIAKMIKSSENYEHLNICRDVINRFIRERFKNHISMSQMAISEDHLFFLISEKERVLDYK